MRRILLAALFLFLSSSHAFVLVPSAHARPLGAPPSAHVHLLAALPLTHAHPLVARGGALPRGNEVMMILNPFSNAVTDDISEMLKVCVLPTPPCTRAERGVRATHLHTHPHPTPAQPYHSRRNQPAPPQWCGFADPFLPRRVWRRTRENNKRLCSQSSSSLHSSSAL